MRPPRIHYQNSTRIAVIAITFLMILSWTVILASAQDGTTQKKLRKGTIHRASKLAVQKYGHRSVLLNSTWYKLSKSTQFLDSSGARIATKSIPEGSLVSITYMTDKDETEEYPFSAKDNVLITIQNISSEGK